MSRVILISSGKGGVGKTTCSANIGASFAKMGYKTVIIDTDTGMGNLDVIMGLEDAVNFDIKDAIQSNINSALIQDKNFSNLFIIATLQNKNHLFSFEEIKKLIEQLKKLEFEQIIIDTAAGIDENLKHIAKITEISIIVVNPEVSSIRDASKIINFLEENNNNQTIYVLINRMREKMVKRGEMLSKNDIFSLLSKDIIGIIREDEKVIINTNKGELTILDNSKTSIDFVNTTKRLLGEEIEYKEESNLIDLIKNKIKNFIKSN